MTSRPKIIAIIARTGLETVTPIRLSPLFTVSVMQKPPSTSMYKWVLKFCEYEVFSRKMLNKRLLDLKVKQST